MNMFTLLGVTHGGLAHEATRPRLLDRRLGGRISRCSTARHWANRLSPSTRGKPIAREIGLKANNQFAFGIGFKAITNSTVESVSRRKQSALKAVQTDYIPNPLARTRRAAADGKLGVHAVRRTLTELHDTWDDFRPFRPYSRRARGPQARENKITT